MQSAVSVIVPVLDEEGVLAATLLRARQEGVSEILVVDGGSRDSTTAVAARHADRVLTGAVGRARQMNLGAAHANGDILLFLHADTLVPDGFALAAGAACLEHGAVGGRFDVRLEPSSPLLWLTGELINLRSRLSRMSTGDQAMFVRRDVFERLGGFADIPLMEDLELSLRLKRSGPVACLRQRVATSSRRWRRHGIGRTILTMWSLRFLYFLGVSPTTLRRYYDNAR